MGNAADLQDISTYPSVMEIQTSPNPALRIPDEPDDPLHGGAPSRLLLLQVH